MLNTNYINSIMKKYENYLDNHNKEIITLKQEILNKDRRIEKLEKSNNKAILDYMEIKDRYNKECYENVKLTDIINDTKDLCNGLLKFINTLCFEGYIPQEKYEEQGTYLEMMKANGLMVDIILKTS